VAEFIRVLELRFYDQLKRIDHLGDVLPSQSPGLVLSSLGGGISPVIKAAYTP